MRSGPRDRLITIQRQGEPTDDGYTTQPGSWADFCRAYAEVVYGTGQERREAAQEQATVSATFRVLSNPKTRDVKPTDRIVYEGDWDIISNVHLGRDGQEMTAVRRTDGA